MLKRENRLKKNRHFNYIYKHGSSVKVGEVVRVYIKLKVKPYKVGFSVGSKVGKSVVRSKIKRQMSEAFKLLIPFVDKRYNYIFVAREKISEKSFFEIKDMMHACIKKAGLENEIDC